MSWLYYASLSIFEMFLFVFVNCEFPPTSVKFLYSTVKKIDIFVLFIIKVVYALISLSWDIILSLIIAIL